MSALERALRAASADAPGLVVLRDTDTRMAHAGDESGLDAAMPAAVIFAHDAHQVASLLRAASAEGVSVTPRGGATGKSGGAIPDVDGIALVLTTLTRSLEVDAEDRVLVASANVTTMDVHDAAAEAGLYYAPDPSSWLTSTLGGNIATNASGPSSLKHGDTACWTWGLEVVTGSGAILSMPRRTSKSSVGYDLVSLFAGSEGTLGVITKAWMRLAPAPARVVLACVLLRSLSDLSATFRAIDSAHLSPRCIELLDDTTLEVMRNEGSKSTLVREGVEAVLLIELEGSERTVEDELERLANAVDAYAIDVLLAKNESEREAFWKVRREMSYALKRSAKFKLSDDVVVPRSQVAALISACRKLGNTHGLRMPTYGHAGDGNLHVNFLWDDAAQRPQVERAMDALFDEVVALQGTLSGEHGLGRAKARYLSLVHSPERIAHQRAIKNVFDPAGILNRGKVLL